MLVLDPNKRVQAHELLGDLWFTRGAKKDFSNSLVHETDLVRDGSSSAHSLGWWKGAFATARRSLGL